MATSNNTLSTVDKNGERVVPRGADEIRRYAIDRLTLTHFRNYPSLRIEADGRPIVLTGANGAGKTNILEAISLLVPGRGLRRAKLSEMANDQGPGDWGVAAKITTPNGPVFPSYRQ